MDGLDGDDAPTPKGVSLWKQWLGGFGKAFGQPPKKRLRVCESISLGEKRFVAVIQVDGEQLLVGGSSNSLSVLARMERSPAFLDVLRKQIEQGRSSK
jgi:flagellar biogenesis protein FliO